MLHHLSKRQKVIVMLAVMSGLFLAALDQTIVGTALPKILSEFNALKELTWVVTAYLLTSTIAVPIAGKLSDLYGRRRLLLIGIVLFVASSLLCGVAQNIEQMIAFRALQGIGGGILFANAFAIIGDLFDARERGKWQGIFGAVFGLSSLVGPLLGGFLTDGHSLLGVTTDWRWTFLINIPVGILSFALIAKYMPSIKSTVVKPVIDYLGGALLTIGLSALVLATSLGGTTMELWGTSVDLAWNSPTILAMLAVTVAALTGFVFTERKAKDPILPLHFFKSPIFNVISILFLLFGAGFFSAIIYVPTFAQQVLNFSATNSGIIMLPMVLGLTAASIGVGQLVNKTGKYKAFIVGGMFIGTLGILSMSTLSAQSTYMDLAWRMALTGVGMGMAMPIFALAVQNALPQKDLGAATSSTQLFRSIGGTVGLAIMGGILNNILASKLVDAKSEQFVQIAQANGQGAQFSNLDVNSIQGILSPEAQAGITQQLQNLPPQAQQQALDAFHHFVGSLQAALASSMTQVFLIAAGIMAVAFIISFFVKEVPLKHHDSVVPSE
ncbi:MAG TPA: MDR family MFS transporter [Candidatus Saccharimonadales bacterium]|nr:MDR family MFS transporter [Candidatus Saccharimonadales bacterium]